MIKIKSRSGLFVICILILSFILSVALQFNTTQSIEEYGSVEEVEITVLLDNYPNSTLYNPWGVSFYIEVNDYTILFDAGLEPNALGNNSLTLGKDISQVDLVIISHEHADHYFGIEYVAEVNSGLDVYVPISMIGPVKLELTNWGFNVVNVLDTIVLQPGIAIIGQLFGPPYEIALAINVENVGLVVIVGCSHPGVENIVTKAVDDLSIDPYLVIGGFHLMGASLAVLESTTTTLLDLGTDYIYPIHCCGDAIREYIETNFPTHYGEGCVGTHLIIDQSLAPTVVNPINGIISVIVIITLPIIIKWQKRRKQINR